MSAYWSHLLEARLNRRRALAASGTAVTSALFLAACGGSESKPASKEASSLLTRPVDTSAKAVPGGVWQTSTPADVTTLDPHVNASGGGFNQLSPVYDNLVRYDRGKDGKDGALIGDAADSWEFSPDGLTLTFKLRPNLKFDPRPPTNERLMTAADVKFSFERTISKSAYAPDWAASRNPEAPVTSLTTPDDKTVVFKLTFPYLGMLQILAHNTYLYILPQEADGKFDPRSEARGTGPFTLDKWLPSQRFEFKKNPEWIEKDKRRPFLDGIQRTIIPDYAAGLAQFETGNIWDYAVKPEDTLRVKRDHPAMELRQSWVTGTGGRGHIMVLSQQPDSPMRDVRVRRAASMLINRQSWIEAMYGTEKFTSAGLPVDIRWNSHIPGYMAEWLDPKGKELGEGAKYFQYDVAEAKKLLSAAGYGKGLKLSHFYSTNAPDYTPYNTTLNGMFTEALTTDFRPLDYNTEWREVCQRSLGTGYNGFCYLPVSGFNAENYLQTKYTPEGKAAISGQSIPVLTDLARKIKTEINTQKQQELIKQAQREAAMAMPDIVLPGFSYGFQLNHPWLENYGVFTGDWLSARLYLDYWYNAQRRSSAEDRGRFMDGTKYWSQTLSRRTQRRRFIAGGVAAGAGLLALSCSGSDSKKPGSGSSSSMLYEPVDSTSKATKGGILNLIGNTRGFDVLRSAAENGNASPAYSRLVKYDVVRYPQRPQPNVVADAATSWEVAPDGLSATYKLRHNLKFDPRPPTNGKLMTSADLKYSWELFESKAVARANLANSASPEAPIVSIAAPDANTVTFKLAFRYAPLNPMLAFNRHMYVLASESSSTKLNVEMRGTGAYRMREYLPDSRAVFDKNPEWYDADKVKLDGIVYYMINEYASQLAQFRTGALDTMDVAQEDVLITKGDQPKLLMLGNTEFDRTPFWLRFGYLPGSPFRDERVRKAVSMSTDRDLYVDTFGNVESFRKQGLESPAAWHSCFGAGEPSWLDPKDTKAFGENAKWYRFDPAEAKKLMTAAGYKDPLETKFTLSGNPGEGTLSRPAEVLAGMWNANRLFNFKMNYVELNTVFRPQYHYNYDKHEGVAIGGGGADYPDPDGNLQVNFKSGQDRTGHLDANGQPDAYLDGLIEKQRAEADWNKRLTMFHDFQRHFAGKMYFLHQPGDALGFRLAQPWFGNWRVYNGQSNAGGGSEMQEGGVYYWIDSSKKA